LKERESVYGDDADCPDLSAALYARARSRSSRPELNEWFNRLASGKGLCCSFADGFVVIDGYCFAIGSAATTGSRPAAERLTALLT
jgi:hypothetical protein